MYGRVDRGGSREGNKSLRKNKVRRNTAIAYALMRENMS